MNLHSLKRTPGSTHRRKRVGRGHGSGMGKTSGKGHKGQMARTGHKRKVLFEGGQLRLIQRIPIRGFTNPCRKENLPVNLGQLDKVFDSGAEVNLENMAAAGLTNGPFDGVKILAKGELTKPLNISAHAFSASARTAIEAAGGSCSVIEIVRAEKVKKPTKSEKS
jgi:large subunit ribosomal protein L15